MFKLIPLEAFFEKLSKKEPNFQQMGKKKLKNILKVNFQSLHNHWFVCCPPE